MAGKIYPIVYVRGYAGTQGEVEDTVADPYMGFNIGSTKLRQNADGSVAKHIFESPLIRLMKELGYQDVYVDGNELETQTRADYNSVWIYRYYEPVSEDLGDGERPEMETYALGLGEYLQKVRAAVCGKSQSKLADFKVYLVAHSMGGLVVRCWLQNTRKEETNPVDVEKIFTYATPHRGIELKGVGNVPELFRVNNTENFNHDRMREYLKLEAKDAHGNYLEPVHSLNDEFPEEKFFSLIGTNYKDYDAVFGLSKNAVGALSDGLVKIKNAYVKGSPRAFTHRAHSGHFGIVNSEEGYQNLRRFFFGDVRVDGCMKINSLSLPKKIAKAESDGKKIEAAYHLEVVTKVRDARWDLYRRTVQDESAIYLSHDEVSQPGHEVMLFSSFLAIGAINTKAPKNRRNSTEMGFAINVGMLAPEFVVDNKFFFDDYYVGEYIFNDQLKLKVKVESSQTVVKYHWTSQEDNDWATEILVGPLTSPWLISIPYVKAGQPGIDASFELTVHPVD